MAAHDTVMTRGEEFQARAEELMAQVPVLRGISHLIAFFIAIIGGVLLVMQSEMPREFAAALIYSLGMSLSLGTSAAYHRLPWSPSAKRLVRKLDHAMIFIFFGATYTPVALLALEGSWRTTSLACMWVVCLAGVAARFGFRKLSRRALTGMYLGLGWIGLVFLPEIYQHLQTGSVLLLIAGGVLYTFGAMAYLFKRPNPLPRVFGFHEIFHAFVIGGAACHYAAVFPLFAG